MKSQGGGFLVTEFTSAISLQPQPFFRAENATFLDDKDDDDDDTDDDYHYVGSIVTPGYMDSLPWHPHCCSRLVVGTWLCPPGRTAQ